MFDAGQRPSIKELNRKLRQARDLAENGKWLPAELQKITPDFQKLNLFDAEAQDRAIQVALGEVTPEHYSGHRPPQRAYEPTIAYQEMFSFTWDSVEFGRKMYMKFSVTHERLWLVSFHPSKPE